MLKESRQGKNASHAINILWEEGFFNVARTLQAVAQRLGSRGNNFSSVELSKALARAKFLSRRGKRGAFKYIQKVSAASKEIKSIEDDLFSDVLIKKLGKNFEIEINDLRNNFGKSGNCTAFLLRKILEKLIYITFAKNNLTNKLEDVKNSGKLVGLNTMINCATTERVNNIPFITSKTGQEIKGIKFLGDTSAHNPLVEVDMKTIIPQMPFIITAYKELAGKL